MRNFRQTRQGHCNHNKRGLFTQGSTLSDPDRGSDINKEEGGVICPDGTRGHRRRASAQENVGVRGGFRGDKGLDDIWKDILKEYLLKYG